MPSLIRLSYRFGITYAFSNIRFLKVPRSEEKERWGWFYGDKGYISGLLEWEFAENGVTLITGVKKYETKSDETLEPPDAPETIYY
nr:transposase [Candidatus Enterovibrio escacola]